MSDPAIKQVDTKIGLGDAIQRLIAVERRYVHMHSNVPEELLAERNMLMEALNQFELDLGWSCEIQPGLEIPENVQLFETAVKTSCCRIGSFQSSRRDTLAAPIAPVVERPAPPPAPEPVSQPEPEPEPEAVVEPEPEPQARRAKPKSPFDVPGIQKNEPEPEPEPEEELPWYRRRLGRGRRK